MEHMNPNDLITAYREGTLLNFVNEHIDELLETNGEPEWAAEHIDLSIPPRYGREVEPFNYMKITNKLLDYDEFNPFLWRLYIAIVLENIEFSRQYREYYITVIDKLYEYRRELPWAQWLCITLIQDYIKDPYMVNGVPRLPIHLRDRHD